LGKSEIYLIVSKCNRYSASHQTSPPNCNLCASRGRDWVVRCFESISSAEVTQNSRAPTCWLKVIFSCWDSLVKLDKKESGKTKAALPTKTKPSRIELTPTDVPGLQRAKTKFAS